MSPVERIALAPADDNLENSTHCPSKQPFVVVVSASSIGKPTLKLSIVAKVRNHK